MKNRARLAALLTGVLLVLGACGTQNADTGARSDSGSVASGSPTTGTTRAGEPEGPAVDLSFTATTVDGKTFDGKSLMGKPALLWFWAPWCPTCASQSPQVKELAEKYAGRVTVVGVSGLDDLEAIRRFARQAELDFPNLADTEGTVWRRFGVTAQSTFVLLDAKGAVVADGYLDRSDLEQQVGTLAG